MTGEQTDTDELTRLTRELNECTAEMEQFAYIVSHDLQAPLRTQMSFIQLLRMEYADKLEGDATEYLRFIESSAETMQGLIQALLAFSRAGRFEIGHDLVSLNDVLKAAAAEVKDLARERDAEIHAEALPSIEGNHDTLTQLFGHILKNALQFTPSDTKPHIQIRTKTDGDEVTIHVQDNGAGIATDMQEEAFEIFRRVHSNRDFPNGAGMGLAVSRRIVHRHGGSIHFLPSEQGACVEICLPLKQPNAE